MNIYWPVVIFCTFFTAKFCFAQVTFPTNCNDPAVVAHTATFGHSYCTHVCRAFNPAAECEAGADGDCNCPCSLIDPALNPGPTFDPSLCPKAGDPADPDPTHLATCKARCMAKCPGNSLADGVICGEIGTPVFKVCTCICPRLCGAPTTPVVTVNSTQLVSLATSSNSLTINPLKFVVAYKLFLYYNLLILALKKLLITIAVKVCLAVLCAALLFS